jgi:23S rRNA G2445 N2-methylase RlmL
VKDRATIYLDLAGDPLHRRGYRLRGAVAPLKETLAAAILRLSGWDRERPLIDPMCGSGTIALEGALWARNIAPGLARPRFGFERWLNFDGTEKARMLELRQAARARVRREGPEILASDIDDEALDAAAENARRSGLSLAFRRADIKDLSPSTRPGHVVTNPPYDERLAADAFLYAAMARSFVKLHGHRVSILANGPEVVRPIRLRPSSSFEVFNGDIPCRLISFEIPR